MNTMFRKDITSIRGLKQRVIKLLNIGWTKGTYAKDANGKDVGPSDPRACRWCLDGAIQAATNDTLLKSKFRDLLGGNHIKLNDSAISKDKVIKLVQNVKGKR